jgi:multidrug efflux pump subunit AcrB
MLGHYVFKRGQSAEGMTAANMAGCSFVSTAACCGSRRKLLVRYLVIPALIGAITVVCFMLFGADQAAVLPRFSNTPLFFVHYKLAQGASIHACRDMTCRCSRQWLAEQPEVVSHTSYAVAGAIALHADLRSPKTRNRATAT